MPVLIPRRLRSEPAGRFGPLGVDRHEVEAGGAAYTAFTLALEDWVAVTAITDGGQILLVRQHRHGVDDLTLEVAGGIIDPGESPEVAALRELREETGYMADAVEPLGWVHPNPAIQGNRCWMFLARGARRVGEPDGDEHESVEPVLLAPEDAAAAARDGRISHVLAVVALERALVRLGSPGRSGASELLRRAHALLDSMEEVQRQKVIGLARRLLPHLTAEDLRNPHDFPDLDDPDWHFEDGQLAGIQAVRFALHGLARDVLNDGEADPGQGSAGEGGEGGG